MNPDGARSEAFGTRSPDGRLWWNGFVWQVIPDAFVEIPPPQWPPAGYYRRPTSGRLTHWNGTAWGAVYWQRWRMVAALAVLAIGGFVTLYFMGGALGDPGMGGNTKALEDRSRLSFELFVTSGTVTAGLLLLLTWSALRSPVKAATRWYEWAARGAALSLALGLVAGVWIVLYGFQPWPRLDRTVASYPTPPHWSAHGKPVRNDSCSSLRTQVDPGCPPEPPSETLTFLPDHSPGNSHPEISTAKSRAAERNACATLRESARAWAKVGFVESTARNGNRTYNWCQVQGSIRGQWAVLTVDTCCTFSDPAQGAPVINVEVSTEMLE